MKTMPTVMSCLKQAWSSWLPGNRAAEEPASSGALVAEQLMLRCCPLRLLAGGCMAWAASAPAAGQPALLALLLFSGAADRAPEPLTRQPR